MSDNSFNDWINLSLRAPSGDNCQPWLFKIYDSSFEIRIDHKKVDHFLDQNIAASWISLGCLFFNLKKSAPYYGFNCKCELNSESSIIVYFWREQKTNDPKLISDIIKRRTYRGIMMKDYSPDISMHNYDQSIFKWSFKGAKSIDFLHLWAELESIVWIKTTLMRDFTKWINIGRKKFTEGIDLKNLMINFFDKISIITFKKFPDLIKIVPIIPFRITSFIRLKFLIKNSSGIVFLSGKFNNYNDFFLAGQEIQSMWLYLTNNGFEVQPMAIESLFFNYTDSEVSTKLLSAHYLNRVKFIEKQTYIKLDIDTKQKIIFMFRVGKSFGTAEEYLPRNDIEKLIASE